MSDEMAVIDKVGIEDVKVNSVEEPPEAEEVPEEASEEQPAETPNQQSDEPSETTEGNFHITLLLL